MQPIRGNIKRPPQSPYVYTCREISCSDIKSHGLDQSELVTYLPSRHKNTQRAQNVNRLYHQAMGCLLQQRYAYLCMYELPPHAVCSLTGLIWGISCGGPWRQTPLSATCPSSAPSPFSRGGQADRRSRSPRECPILVATAQYLPRTHSGHSYHGGGHFEREKNVKIASVRLVERCTCIHSRVNDGVWLEFRKLRSSPSSVKTNLSTLVRCSSN